MPKTVYFKTLGCKVNQYETQGMRESLIRNGFSEMDRPEEADYCVVNSCTVTHHSDRKALYYIRRFKRHNPQGKVVLTGCLTHDNLTGLLKNVDVDIILPNDRKMNIAHALLPQTPHPIKTNMEDTCRGISSFKGHMRAFVKVQDGCNMNCSYCKVRIVRGSSRSRRLSDIRDEVRRLADNGYQEIVLTGIQIGAYGKDFKEKKGLVDLLDEILTIPLIKRVRLSSIEPFDVSRELIHSMAITERLCPHLHIPLQSGDDQILRLMRRPYTRIQYKELIDCLRETIPSFGLSTDVIVGFPSEDNNAFYNTLSLLEDVRPFKIHIFPFSPRAGTDAYCFENKVSSSIVKRREQNVQQINDMLFNKMALELRGTTQNVLIEGSINSYSSELRGRTRQYVKVLVKGDASLINTIIPVTILDNGKDYLKGERIA
ncbi:MAG: tRNA (N(6)-L-threonylcarbamoyladenosine(37)-C(2))-methylthiotransferase MtaB [Candidatus Omnitrophica bacterium]|nr:tRNA (N(6)-L-threonylcarbamoyladenosine(37)-C(2))-methylthiotransferase MtaB [Candidatus Omnitrophota bacterium]